MRRAIAILSAFALAAPILADEIIYMRDGTIVTGRIKFQNPERVVISTGEGEQTIEKSRIRRIAFASESEKEIAAQIQDLEEKRKACENLEKEMEERCDRRVQEALQAERTRAERRARVAAEDYRSRLRSAALWNAVVPGAGYRKLGETNKGFFFTAAAAGSLLYYYQSHRRSVSLRSDYRAMTAFSFAGQPLAPHRPLDCCSQKPIKSASARTRMRAQATRRLRSSRASTPPELPSLHSAGPHPVTGSSFLTLSAIDESGAKPQKPLLRHRERSETLNKRQDADCTFHQQSAANRRRRSS